MWGFNEIDELDSSCYWESSMDDGNGNSIGKIITGCGEMWNQEEELWRDQNI